MEVSLRSECDIIVSTCTFSRRLTKGSSTAKKIAHMMPKGLENLRVVYVSRRRRDEWHLVQRFKTLSRRE